MSTIDDLLAYNASHPSPSDAAASPSRKLAIVACMDARLDVLRLLGLGAGDAHVIRNAGGIVTEDVIRSLTISQRLLATRAILIIAHNDCGMQRFEDDEFKDTIERETGVRPDFPMGAFADLEAEVRKSLALIAESPLIPHTDDLRGCIYQVDTGRLREVS